MNDSHVTLRLSAALARALTRWAREHAVPKSHVVREAVTQYLRGPRPAARPEVTAADVATRWPALPRLAPEEAAAFADDLADARATLPAPTPWA